MIYENPLLSGSVQISGSLYVQGLRLISSSNQIASEISGSQTLLDKRIKELLANNYQRKNEFKSKIICR